MKDLKLNMEAGEIQSVFGMDETIYDLANFNLEERLGGGSTSEVFRASHDGKQFAIKQYRHGIGGAKDYDNVRNAFIREVSLFRDLNGTAHIPKFYGIGAESNGRGKFKTYQPALIMEYISGKTIAERIAGGERFSGEEVKNILMQVLDPLEALHHGNDVPRYHRDLKPANIKIDEKGEVYLLDFGSLRDTIIGTFGGTMAVGTLGYTHFEQFSGSPSFRTELYSLGRVLYAAATGKELTDKDEVNEINLANLDSKIREAIVLMANKDLSKGPQNIKKLRKMLTDSVEIAVVNPAETVANIKELREEFDMTKYYLACISCIWGGALPFLEFASYIFSGELSHSLLETVMIEGFVVAGIGAVCTPVYLRSRRLFIEEEKKLELMLRKNAAQKALQKSQNVPLLTSDVGKNNSLEFLLSRQYKNNKR